MANRFQDKALLFGGREERHYSNHQGSIYTTYQRGTMTECQPDEWVDGLWFIVSGIILSVAGCASIFAVSPVLRD